MDSNKPTYSTPGVVVVASTNRLAAAFSMIIYDSLEI